MKGGLTMEITGSILIGIGETLLGLFAIFVVSKAHKDMGGLLGDSVKVLKWSLIFLAISSFTRAARDIIGINKNYNELSWYPEFIFSVLAFAGFVLLAVKLLKITKL